APMAQWVLMAAHPTLVPRRGGALDPDYPGRVAAALETKGGVATVLQTAGGNASAALALDAFSDAVVQEVAKVPTSSPLATLDIGYAAFEVQLPHPDGTRLVPAVLLPATENLLCARASMVAEVGAVRLGPLVLLSVPAEVTLAAAQRLVGATGAQVVSLANGYTGYVESDALVRLGEGEAKRQYFPPEVVKLLAEGARLALDGAGPATMTAVPQ
ncbi:MAG: hypothetical protein JNG84_00715, partial [Archangium sp.]|nr:hypothetical protein [Archangium sp.]